MEHKELIHEAKYS